MKVKSHANLTNNKNKLKGISNTLKYSKFYVIHSRKPVCQGNMKIIQNSRFGSNIGIEKSRIFKQVENSSFLVKKKKILCNWQTEEKEEIWSVEMS